MLMYFLLPLAHQWPVLHIFKYLTFRTGGGTLTAVILSFIFGRRVISWLKSRQGEGQPIRGDGPETHLSKKGTPTMGGILILGTLTLSTLLWGDLTNPFLWIVLFVTIGFGIIGARDDFLKLTKRNSKGLSGRKKLLFQFLLAGAACFLISMNHEIPLRNALSIPFLKGVLFQFGWFYLPFMMVVIVGASNAVNLTDGLDGLATVPVMVAAGCYCLIAYLVGNHVFANYLQLQWVPGSGELSIFCGALIGAGMGFLWFNAPPAMVFMGDTGSLSAGAALGTISVVTKHELVLLIVGGIFVVEAVSVILQVLFFKATGRRIFLMAPIHHHFEKKGWAESTVVIRFWVIAFILALIGLSTLKLR